MEGGNGQKPAGEVKCPLCNQSDWLKAPSLVFMAAVGVRPEFGVGLYAQPYQCRCGFIRLMFADPPPGAQFDPDSPS